MAEFIANYFFVLEPADCGCGGGGPGEYIPYFVGDGSFVASNGDPASTTFDPGQTILVDLGSPDPDAFTYIGQYGHGWVGEFSITDPDTGETASLKVLLTNDCLCETDFVTIDPAAFAVCFLAGTRIATPEGWCDVEALAIGDLVLTAGGEARAVKWIGRQEVVAVFAEPLRSFPIRIAAGALAEGVPARDLFLSPAHGVMWEGLLVEAAALVNGSTVTRVMRPEPRFTWYHVEMEDHAVILAEGTPVETFVDNRTRARFDNHAEFVALYGEAGSAEMEAPRVKSARQLPVAMRARLAARAVSGPSRQAAA
ncbi:Hint domain-containing protein [Roseococcus sp. YIM B11640]|uniref:Hint domain-containing protein n=1 Tax=Roseococcus sp. YIM B11640 TaxID=3133973 RepID=UPI003C79B02F